MNKKQPKLRFPEFSGDWENKKLSQFLVEFSKKSTKENEYPLLSSTNSGMELRVGRISGSSNRGYKIIDNDNLVLSPQNLWLGNINVNHLGIGLVSPSYKTFKIKNFYPKFFKLQLRTDKILDAYKQASSQGASVVRRNLDLDAFYQIVIIAPKIDEQQKIGLFFKDLDDNIELNRNKLTELKELKSGLLQKMFPKKGAKVPEVRFPEFSGDWTEFSFSELVNRVNKTSNSNVLPKVEFEDIIAGEGRLNKDISLKFDDRKGIHFHANYILYGKLRPYLKNWLFSDFEGVALGDFWIFEAKNTEPIFIYYLIQSDSFQKIANDTSGTKMPRSDWKLVSSCLFEIPTLKEQQKIGAFFKNIDELIKAQQHKLTLLTEQKKALLQQMFV